MNLMESAKRWIVPLLICSALLVLLSWKLTTSNSNVVEMPPVTEESLSPEQKAQLERLRQIQAGAMQQAGINNQVPTDPREFAKQLMEQDRAQKAGEGGNVAPEAPAQ